MVVGDPPLVSSNGLWEFLITPDSLSVVLRSVYTKAVYWQTGFPSAITKIWLEGGCNGYLVAYNYGTRVWAGLGYCINNPTITIGDDLDLNIGGNDYRTNTRLCSAGYYSSTGAIPCKACATGKP